MTANTFINDGYGYSGETTWYVNNEPIEVDSQPYTIITTTGGVAQPIQYYIPENSVPKIVPTVTLEKVKEFYDWLKQNGKDLEEEEESHALCVASIIDKMEEIFEELSNEEEHKYAMPGVFITEGVQPGDVVIEMNDAAVMRRTNPEDFGDEDNHIF